MEEIWKDIEITSPIYQISSLGRVRLKGKEQPIKAMRNRDGYLRIRIPINGKRITKSLHRIVAITFIPNPENKPYVNHIDGNKHNNFLINLEWCTGSENMKHAYAIGLQKVSEKQKIATAIHAILNYSKPVLQFDLNGKFISRHHSATEAARSVNGHQSNISSACRGELNRAYKSIWRYE